jgi:hypothetical protein
MARTVQDMLADANACVPKISPAEAQKLIRDKGALLVDVREAPERLGPCCSRFERRQVGRAPARRRIHAQWFVTDSASYPLISVHSE